MERIKLLLYNGQYDEDEYQEYCRLTDDSTIQEFKRANFKKKDDIELCDKCFYGQKIYIRKIERLYHLIRIHKTRYWWE